MGPIIIAVVFAIGCVAVYWTYQRAARPSVAVWGEISDAILNLQDIAAKNVVPLEQSNKFTGIDENQSLRQTCHVSDTVRFVYTIDETETGFVHVVSSQLLRRKPEKYQIQCMLVAMLALNRSLTDAGIDPKTVEFDIGQSALGTHFLGMSLTRDMHQRLMAKRRSA